MDGYALGREDVRGKVRTCRGSVEMMGSTVHHSYQLCGSYMYLMVAYSFLPSLLPL